MLVAEVDPQNAEIYVHRNTTHGSLRMVYAVKETGSPVAG